MDEIKIERCIKKFDAKADKYISHDDIDKAYTTIRISADIQYQWNQCYTDDSLENCIEYMVRRKQKIITEYVPKENVLLFYDGFGLDTRGLALIYLKALCELDYSVIYVVPEKARYQQSEIHKVTEGKDITFHYLVSDRGDALTNELLHLFYRYRPKTAFLYTYPNDVEACVAFGAMAGKITRFQINLTDHAFWLGRNAFDYCVEFRNYGACVSHKYRHIAAEKIRLLHYYPYFDKDVPFEGFPFDVDDRPILFSGGSLYKTFDDKETYYQMVDEILQRHEELLFVYAGAGDKTGLKKLQTRYPARVFVLDERKDLYAVMKHSTIYLNTYPMIGGLMTQYAAVAGKLPLTLLNCPDNSLDGLILNHKDMRLEFKNKDDLVSEVDKLLSDRQYRKITESKLISRVMDEYTFRCELNNLVTIGKTKFEVCLHDIDTSEFRKSYKYRFSMESLAGSIINKKTVLLWKYYPRLLIYRVVKRIAQSIDRARQNI